MPEKFIDWGIIRKDRDNGMSLRTLAIKYGISKSYIGEKLSSGQTGQTGQAPLPQPLPMQRTSPMPAESTTQSDLSKTIAQSFIRAIARHATGTLKPNDLDPKDLKLLADALSQYHKIIVTVDTENPNDKPTASGLPAELLPYATLDELAALDTIINAIEARKLEAEGIRTIGKR